LFSDSFRDLLFGGVSTLAKVLIIDDDEMMCSLLSEVVAQKGHEVATALTLKQGIEQALSGVFDVVFLDVSLPDGSGLNALPKIRDTQSCPEVIIITGLGDPDGAELAIKSGAWDYIQKPASIKQMTLPLVRALQYREEKQILKPLVAVKREGIVGNSREIQECLDLLAQSANSTANVLITGETGTGKELFARAIHVNSDRRANAFVVVDCAALPETLVESVLFGHRKGAFTGADRTYDGLVRQADGGTLFLDEVGELPISVQKTFLRVLQEHHFRPVGARKEETSDFRLLAATNRDLYQMVQTGGFRSDLLFRLRTLTIVLPPLRYHLEDIKDLVLHHVARLCKRYETGTKGFSPDFFEILEAYDWPGNVRELFNTLETAVSVARYEPTLFPKHLPLHIRVHAARTAVGKGKQLPPSDVTSLPPADEQFPSLRDFRHQAAEQAEKEYLRELTALTRDNIEQACRISMLSRSRLYELLKKHSISIHN
jgi:two-component system NtrC family response regulator